MKKAMFFAVGAAVGCLVLWTTTRPARREVEREGGETSSESVDLAAEDSFPASDPPSYSGAHV